MKLNNPKKRIMRDFQIKEISSVDVPAQEGALAAIVKSADADDDINKAKTKTEGGVAYPASDFAYVPDPEKPSTWKLRLTSTPGGNPDPRIVGAAAAALGPGYRGNRVELPESDRAKVVARVRRAWVEANPDKDKSEMPEALKVSEEDIVNGLTENLAKRWIDPADGPVPFATVLAEDLKSSMYYENMEHVSPYICAMETAVRSIAGSSVISPDTKFSMIRNQVEDFMMAIRGVWSDAMDAMSMYATNTKGAEMATNNDELTKAQATIDDLKKQVENLTKAAEDAAKAAEDAAEKALSAAEKEYIATLDAKGRKAFMAMTPEDRKKAMGVKKGADETIEVDGASISKSAVGSEVFEFMKSLNGKLEAAQKTASDERARREKAEFEKVAQDSYSDLPGELAEKAAALRELSTLSAESQACIEKMLGAGQEAIAKAFTTIGTSGGNTKDISVTKGAERAEHPFMKRVNEIVASQKISKTEAMAKARRESPEEFNSYRASN